jgi:hypothetical protein
MHCPRLLSGLAGRDKKKSENSSALMSGEFSLSLTLSLCMFGGRRTSLNKLANRKWGRELI